MIETEENQDSPGVKRRKSKIANLERIHRIIQAFQKAAKENKWDTYWTIDEIVMIAFEEQYVTEKKKKSTSYYLTQARRLLRLNQDLVVQHVPRKGYRIWPAFSKIPKEFQSDATDDAMSVFEAWFSFAQKLFAPQGILRTMSERGQLELSADTIKKISETRLLLKEFENKEDV